MGTKDSPCALSGVWSGRFIHDDPCQDGAAFSAWLSIASDRITGSTLEPNTFAPGDLEELDALLRGHVHDDEVVLLKTYQGLDQEPVYCEGKITDNGHRIVGRWYFSWPDEISGTFEMSRQIAKAKADQSASGKAAL